MTVRELYNHCAFQISKGNGDKQILISNDDEGNGYHTLFYEFCDEPEEIQGAADMGMFHDFNNPDDVVLLG